jgi:hypothetical protein
MQPGRARARHPDAARGQRGAPVRIVHHERRTCAGRPDRAGGPEPRESHWREGRGATCHSATFAGNCAANGGRLVGRAGRGWGVANRDNRISWDPRTTSRERSSGKGFSATGWPAWNVPASRDCSDRRVPRSRDCSERHGHGTAASNRHERVSGRSAPDRDDRRRGTCGARTPHWTCVCGLLLRGLGGSGRGLR